MQCVRILTDDSEAGGNGNLPARGGTMNKKTERSLLCAVLAASLLTGCCKGSPQAPKNTAPPDDEVTATEAALTFTETTALPADTAAGTGSVTTQTTAASGTGTAKAQSGTQSGSIVQGTLPAVKEELHQYNIEEIGLSFAFPSNFLFNSSYQSDDDNDGIWKVKKLNVGQFHINDLELYGPRALYSAYRLNPTRVGNRQYLETDAIRLYIREKGLNFDVRKTAEHDFKAKDFTELESEEQHYADGRSFTMALTAFSGRYGALPRGDGYGMILEFPCADGKYECVLYLFDQTDTRDELYGKVIESFNVK